MFGNAANKLSISSTKSMHGHCLGAGGGIEAVAAIKAINEKFVPATVGLDEPDPECDLDYTPNVGREARGQLRHVELVCLRRTERRSRVRTPAGLRRALPRSSRLIVVIGFAGLVGLVVAYAVLGYLRSMRQERGIATHAEEIFRSPTSFVAGNPQGDVSVVAFLDYNCPYCRARRARTRAAARDGRQGPARAERASRARQGLREQVARIALAAAAQGKYFELHQRLFAESGRATKAKALRIASELGLDVGRLERDMDDPTITAALLENTRLARDIGVRGVPFYLVGDRVLGEGNDLYGQLSQKVADIREHGCRTSC